MATMKDIITSPLLLALVIGGLVYIAGFSLVYLKKAYDHCLDLGITKKELSNVIRTSLIFSIVPSLSIVVGLFVLIAVLGSVWAWWRLSVIGSLSYETMISSSIAQVLGYASSAEMLEAATGRQFGVVMILMSVGMLSGFLILLPFGKKLCKSVDRTAADKGGSTWKNVLSGVFMLVMFSVYIPILLFTDNVQAAVMITGLIIAVAVAVSSIMTVVILKLAAVCASFISPVFELPAVKTASGYLLPALFGSMALGLFASSSSGDKVVKGGLKGVLPVLILMTVLSLAARLAGYGAVLGGLVGIFIIVMLPIGILTSYILWKKGKIQVVDKTEA